MTNTKICKVCGKHIASKGQVCDACRQKYRSLKHKQMSVEYMGGKCSKCGYNESIAALEFHHINPKEKEFAISSAYNKSWDRIKHELDKCIMLCANCHRELHNKENVDNTLSVYEKYINSLSKQEKEIIRKTQKTKKENQEKKLKEKQDKIQKRKELILNSDIDFSKYGWSKELSKFTGITPAATVRWIKAHLPVFYKEKCYREKSLDDSDIDNIISLYKNGKSIGEINKLLKITHSRIATVLKENNITVDGYLKFSKKINMIDIETNTILKTFNTIAEAATYCEDNIHTNRSKNTLLKTIRAKISNCVNKHQKTAYGFKWEEAM